MNTKHINFKYLKDISNGNSDFEKMMINLYLSKTDDELNVLHQAIKDIDMYAIHQKSHKLISTAGFIGAEKLKLDLANIENLSDDNKNIEKIAQLYSQIISNHNQIKVELNEALKHY